MKASGKIGSNGVLVLDNVEKRFETDIWMDMPLSASSYISVSY
jgi:hypothetical protein